MQVYIGIDWSSEKHDIAYLNEQGAVITWQVIPSSVEGFAAFDQQRARLGILPEQYLVGIETHYHLILDYLVEHGYPHLYILPPHLVSSSRGRFGASQASSDPSDARLIADLLRTDRARLRPWQPNGPLLQELAGLVHLEHFLTVTIVRCTNYLRQVLGRYYPNAIQVFSSLDTQIALQFIAAYPTPQPAAELSLEAFVAFATQHHYPQPQKLKACYARLQQPQPVAQSQTVQAAQPTAVHLARISLVLVQARATTRTEISRRFDQHPDAAIFRSLPGAGERLAPALLVKFGDQRSHYPTVKELQAVAGTCPVTKRSGKFKSVHFRRACDHEFRTVVQQWARASVDESVWAHAYLHQILPRCHSVSHAYRCLGNRWLEIAWRLWQDGVPYDEAYHLRQRAVRLRAR